MPYDAQLGKMPDRPSVGIRTHGGEVSLAEHACRCRLHGGRVEGFVDLECPMSVERMPDSVHSDPIAIDAPARLSSRIEARRRGSKGAHGQVGRQRGVQPSSQLRQSAAATRCSCVAECRDLAGGMHPGIGSPGETNSRCLADQPVKRLLQLPLNGPSIRLDLGTGEGRSVVLDHRSCASLRVGGHRSCRSSSVPVLRRARSEPSRPRHPDAAPASRCACIPTSGRRTCRRARSGASPR